MVKYPIKKIGAKDNTATKARVVANTGLGEKDTSVYSHRGMRLESQINLTCEYYLINNIAVIHKKPTPVQVVSFKQGSKYSINEAYYRQASTTDYNGIYKGRYIDFESKETKNHASFTLDNLPKHQFNHMMKVDEHGGIAFVIVGFWRTQEIFLIDIKVLAEFYLNDAIKSVHISIFREKAHLIPSSFTRPVDFIPTIEKVYFGQENK